MDAVYPRNLESFARCFTRVTLETELLRATVPSGSLFKGYEFYQVQDITLSARAVCYRRERWLTPQGKTILAPLPGGIRGHFGPELRGVGALCA